MRTISNIWTRRILRTLFHGQPTTRRAILEATKLNAGSASRALQYLISRGIILKMGVLQSTGGRRTDLLKLNADSGYYVAVDLEGTRLRFALTNLLGDIRYHWAEDIRLGVRMETQRIVTGINMVLQNLEPQERARVLAIGINCPGMIEGGHISAVNLCWNRFPLAQELRKQLELPIFVERSARNYVLAERSFGAAKNSNNFIYLVYQAGVGLGIFVDGRPYHGSGGLEGELGHITIDPSAEDICNCGKKGCLEAITSGPNVVRQYLAKKGLHESNGAHTTVLDIFEAARRGDEVALQVLHRVGTFLGLALSFMVNVFNPEIIILGGDIALGQDVLLPRINEEILRNVPEPYKRALKVQVSPLGLDIGLKGAASLAFIRTISESALMQKLCLPPAARMYVGAAAPNARKAKQ